MYLTWSLPQGRRPEIPAQRPAPVQVFAARLWIAQTATLGAIGFNGTVGSLYFLDTELANRHGYERWNVAECDGFVADGVPWLSRKFRCSLY